jgi:hypothetical protein
MRVTIIAITGNGSLLRYGTREWYVEAFFETLRMNEGWRSDALEIVDAGRELVMMRRAR